MEWDPARVDAAFATFSDAIGDICDVSIETSLETREVEPFYDDDGIGWRQFESVPGSRKAIITITLRKE